MEIGFIAWKRSTEEYVDVNTIDFTDGLINGEDWDDYELLQYTGLVDDNGDEIYVGHIVEVHDGVETTTPHTSRVDMTSNGVLIHSHPAHIALEASYTRNLAHYCNKEAKKTREEMGLELACRIVGNIFENPSPEESKQVESEEDE